MGGILDVTTGKGHSYRPAAGRWVEEGIAEFHLPGKPLMEEKERRPSAAPAFLLLPRLDS